MTPIEEAEQLIRKYYTFGINKEGQTLSWLESKQCALIVVERLIDESRQQENVLRFKYWREVKKHLNNDSTRSQESEELYPQQ